MENIANNTSLEINKDIIMISNIFKQDEDLKINKFSKENSIKKQNQSLSNIYNFLEENPGKVQYMILFCLTE